MYLCVFRLTSIDIKYQIWKFGVVFTDNVSFFFVFFFTKCVCVTVFLSEFILICSLCLNPIPDFPLPGVVHGHVLARSLQQLLLRLSPAGHRHGRQNLAHHPVLRDTQWQAGAAELLFEWI